MASGLFFHLRLAAWFALVLAAAPQSPLGQAASDHPRHEPPQVPLDTTESVGETNHAAVVARAWTLLEDAMKDPKPESRINAVTALGMLRHSERAAAGVEKALSDPDRDVRLAAVDAAATMKSLRLVPALRKALDDPAADISFTASEVLWQMGDKSGEEILLEVLKGERQGAPSALQSGLHHANKDLHNPSTLAMIGAEQTGYALMGPFGVGIDAARLAMRNKASANSARVAVATLLSSDKSSRTDRQLIEALRDKDYFVRAAAARGLGEFHNIETADALLTAFDDSKPLVRFIAAASYIECTTMSPNKTVPVRRGGALSHASPGDKKPAQSQPHK